MVAPPPGWGSRTKRTWAFGIVAYLLALPIGAVAFGSLLYLLVSVFGRLPMQVVGAVALTSVIVGSGLASVRLPQSSWRIPQSWARFGHATYAGLFGGILGLGILTAIPSIGFYTLLVWGLASPSWQAAVAIFGAFGVARALPLLFSAMSAKRRGGYPDEELDGLEKPAKKVAFPAEVFLLGMIGIDFLIHAGI